MDLKQKQASLAEARYARESARDTARQGKTVIVFTVVTIIFVRGLSFTKNDPGTYLLSQVTRLFYRSCLLH